MPTTEWQGIVSQVAPKFLKGASDLTKRNQLWLSLMEKKGRISYGNTGTSVFWTVEYMDIPVTGYSEGGFTFERHDPYKPCELQWRGYSATDMITELQKLKLGGDTEIVNHYKKAMPKLVKTMRKALGLSIYTDGDAAGNTEFFHGLPSFTGAGACAVEDLVAVPSDVYAGNSTTLGQYGSWSTERSGQAQGVGTGYPNSTIGTDWPEGSGDTGYDWNSPVLYNWSSENWVDGTSVTWIKNCEAVLRRVVQHMLNNTGVDASTVMVMMAGDLFSQFKDAMAAKQRILQPYKEAEDLGFPGSLNFEGLGIKAEFGCPSGTFNVFNFDEMELLVLGEDVKELIVSVGPDWSPETGNYLFRVRTLGNLKYTSPKFFAHGEAYAAS